MCLTAFSLKDQPGDESQAILVARPNLCECTVCYAGTVFYGIYYASFYTQYVQMLAAYDLAPPTSEEILKISPSSFQGALAGSGSLSVPHAYTLTSGLVEPLCSGAICQQSIYALAPNTPYQVCRLPTIAADLVLTPTLDVLPRLIHGMHSFNLQF